MPGSATEGRGVAAELPNPTGRLAETSPSYPVLSPMLLVVSNWKLSRSCTEEEKERHSVWLDTRRERANNGDESSK